MLLYLFYFFGNIDFVIDNETKLSDMILQVENTPSRTQNRFLFAFY